MQISDFNKSLVRKRKWQVVHKLVYTTMPKFVLSRVCVILSKEHSWMRCHRGLIFSIDIELTITQHWHSEVGH